MACNSSLQTRRKVPGNSHQASNHFHCDCLDVPQSHGHHSRPSGRETLKYSGNVTSGCTSSADPPKDPAAGFTSTYSSQQQQPVPATGSKVTVPQPTRQQETSPTTGRKPRAGLPASEAASKDPSSSSSNNNVKDTCTELPSLRLTPTQSGNRIRGIHRIHQGAGHRPARQARHSVSDFGPCGRDSGRCRHEVDECNRHDHEGCATETSDSTCPSNPGGEGRRCSQQTRANRREQKRWSKGFHSSPGPRTERAHLGSCSTSSHASMLDWDEGARRYYHHRSTSQESAAMAALAMRGVAEAVSLAWGQQAVEPWSSAGSPLARASLLCEVYFKLLSHG